MKCVFGFALSLLVGASAFAFDHIPTEYQVLTRAEGPSIAAHLGSIDMNQFATSSCGSSAAYNGKTTWQFGTETYHLVSVNVLEGSICPGTLDVKKYSSLVFLFVDDNFGNQIGLSLDQKQLPEVDVILGRENIVPGKALN